MILEWMYNNLHPSCYGDQKGNNSCTSNDITTKRYLQTPIIAMHI